MTTSTLVLLAVLTTFLVVPLVCRKLRVPGIVGFIMTGIIMGPHALGWIPQSGTIDVLGKIGMLYILFQSGVELDLNDFRNYARYSILFGLLSFSLPVVLGLLLGLYVFHFSWLTSLLLAAMLGSHTLMTYPIVSRYGIQRTQAVNIAVGGSMIAITLALTMMALIEPLSHPDVELSGIAEHVALLILFLLLVLYGFPRFARWLLLKRIDTASQFVMTMLLLVASSLLAELAGVDGILGAFLCGLALNPKIPNRSSLMNYINFTGDTIFVPLFLLGVGMMIDVSACWGGSLVWLLAFAMVTSKLIGKWLAAAAIQVLHHMSSTERQLLFGLTHSASAGTLAIATVGYATGLFSQEVMSATVVMIILLCTTSSFFTEVSSRRQALREEALLESDRDEDRWILMTAPSNSPHAQGASALKSPVLSSSQLRRLSDPLRSLAALSSLPDPEYIVPADWKDAIAKVESGWESTIIYHEQQPLSTISRILVAVPAYAEKEHDFISCFGQIRRLSSELGARVVFYCTEDSKEALQSYCRRRGKYLRAEYCTMNDYKDILSIHRDLRRDDIVIFIAARRATVSYDTIFRLLPNMISRFFSDHSYLILYPEQGK